MDLMEDIRFYIKDEKEANETYSRMANDADNAGMHDTARILRGMAADELRHKEMLEGMYYKPEFGPAREPVVEEIKLGGKMIEVPLGRPFPQTYMDWVNLAEDIKDRVGEDLPDYYEANRQLGIISTLEEGNPEEAKRWLTEKAGELGIT